MATSLNNMIDESKLYPGYEFLVTVDRNSENVVLVTGFIGSIKYRGALLSVPPNTIRACVCDNVFNSDFSSKNSFSLANMAITNYYSHKKYKRNNIAMFSVNKRAKENYICANCKMKISYFTKRESKSPPPELSKKLNNNNSGNNNNKNNSTSKNISISYKNSNNDNSSSGNNNINKDSVNNNNLKSDIAVLKQTLSYPDILDDTLQRNIDHSKPLFLSNCSELNSKSLKRKREHTNHVITEKKSKLSISSQFQDMRNSIQKIEEKITQNCKTSLNETIEEPNLAQEKKDQPILEPKSEDKQEEIKREETKRKETEDELKSTEHIDDQIIESEELLETPQNYEEYRSMPLSLCTLNHINSSDNDKTSDDSLNRECPKPKKIWMKMIENEDFQKLIDSPPSSEQVNSGVSVGIKPQPVVHTKINHSNRSYKIKQTLHDKVILTVDKRLGRHKPESHSESISDIYTFSDEVEIIPNAQSSIVNDEILSKSINSVDINAPKKDDSNQSSNSSSDSKTSKSSKISRKSILNDVSKLETINSPNTNHIGKLVIKKELESETGENLFKQNNLTTTISTCENSTGISFNLNDIVWAKITGYPFWPAKIISFSQEEDVFIGCIEWYAWNEISFIKVNSLYHFNTYFSTKYQKRNRNGKYQEAVKLAKYDCGMLDIPGSKTTSDENENTSSIKGSDTDSESNPASYTSASL